MEYFPESFLVITRRTWRPNKMPTDPRQHHKQSKSAVPLKSSWPPQTGPHLAVSQMVQTCPALSKQKSLQGVCVQKDVTVRNTSFCLISWRYSPSHTFMTTMIWTSAEWQDRQRKFRCWNRNPQNRERAYKTDDLVLIGNCCGLYNSFQTAEVVHALFPFKVL